MQHPRLPFHAPTPGPRPALALLGLVLAAAPTAAVPGAGSGPPTRWVVSTTDAAPLGSLLDPDDATLARVELGLPARDWFGAGQWGALAGGLPGDVDAFALRPAGVDGSAGAPHRSALTFSLLSNELGVLDGDVLGLDALGQLEVLVPEAVLAARLGVPEANLDVDALAYDDAGRLTFSLQSDLAGTVLGDVANGDVLRLEPGGGLTRAFTEADVQAALLAAGGGSAAVGDVQGLEWSAGEAYVLLQAPSAVDGTILRLGASPAFVADELAWGLAGVELDALAALPDDATGGSLAFDAAVAHPGDALHAEGHGFAPNAAVLVLVAGQQASLPLGVGAGLGGFGELRLDPADPWLAGILAAGAWPLAVSDGGGSFTADFALPTATAGGVWAGAFGWTFQALDLATLELSSPYRVTVL